MRKRVVITQEHINKGRRNDAASCPIALAVMDVIEARNVIVSGLIKTYHPNDLGGWECVYYRHSARSKQFMRDFDNGKKVLPQTFYITKKES